MFALQAILLFVSVIFDLMGAYNIRKEDLLLVLTCFAFSLMNVRRIRELPQSVPIGQ